MSTPGLRQRLRYRFDNWMARGVGAQIGLLAAAVTILIAITALAVFAFGVTPADEGGQADSFGRVVWKSLMHALDAGAVGGDAGSWTFLFIMLFVTIGGIFVLSALIGILNNGFGALIESLRRGRSTVIESGHTVILGWSSKVETLLAELATANENQRSACVVIIADRDKVAMDEETAAALGGKRLRVVTRSGKPTSMSDLELVSLPTSKAVIVLAPETHADGAPMAAHEADTVVLKCLLAITKVAGQDLHIVAELSDSKSEEVARMVVGDRAALIVAPPLISRLLVQTGRQSGLSMVYSELLDFAGVEMYLTRAPSLVGKAFREAVVAYNDSSLLGVLTKDEQLLLPPAFDHSISDGDRLIVISEDDDTAIVNGKMPVLADASAIVAAPRTPVRQRERTLVLGANARLALVLAELDAYVTAGSETVVVGDAAVLDELELAGLTHNTTVTKQAGDPTDRRQLDALDIGSYNAVLVLSETIGRSQDMADARTMITLLHLRDIARKTGTNVAITSEILDIINRDLATVAEPDDFIVSNTLISLLIAQVAENRHLARIFEDLFTPGGHEIYLKPARDYVKLDVELPYYAVVEAALRRGEIAIGLRRAAKARDASSAFGVVVNPRKDGAVTLGAGDSVIVLADD